MRYFIASVIVSISCYCASAQVVINEICATNADVIYDPDYFNFPAWVELYNAGNNVVDVAGYYISDKSDIPNRYQIPGPATIPAKGYLLIWCDNRDAGLHTNFSLDSDGEDVILSNSQGQLVDKIIFPKQHLNISYGRTSDGGETWNYLSSPTPGKANISNSATIPLDRPDFSVKAGKYASAQNVSITHPVSGAEIRYTVDGSEPTKDSPLYNTPLTIDKTLTLKARAFHESHLPSKTEVKTYFINERNFTLPVIALSTNPEYLNDNTIGIYVVGTNGVIGNGINYAANWNQNWWRHFELEYFSPDGEKQFDESVDIRVGGRYSRRRPQKTFAVKARDKYGSNIIKQKLFPNKPYDRLGGFLLRNSGNDWDLTMFRDAFMHNLLVGEMDVDYQDYQPTIVYLNGEYWGILNMRERIDGDYFESNYGLKEVDLLESGAAEIEGTNERYSIYMDSLTRRVLIGDPKTITFMDRHIDIQEFINYQAANIYYANVDWPGNNLTYWRPRTENGKFRWILWDVDYGFQMSDGHTSPTHPTLEWATAPNNTEGLNKEWSTRHFRTALQNPVFRNRFIQTMTTAIQTTFAPERVINKVDEFRNNISAEMPFHQQRWANPKDWDQHVQKLKNFATARNPYMLTHTAEFFGLGENVNLNVSVLNNSGGKVKLNGVTVDNSKNAFVYFRNLPYNVEPVPLPGYAFKEWTITQRAHERIKPVEKESVWKYYDLGQDPGSGWKTGNFNDNGWASGEAQLGYGEGDEKTVLSFGPDRNNKYITAYFRKQFTITALEKLEDLAGYVIFDDGVVVYLNGIEVYRNNLPAGEITYSTLALRSYARENEFHYFSIDKSLLQEGVNTLAVEVHQNDVTSSDLSFDLYLEVSEVGDVSTFTTSTPAQSGVAYDNITMTAAFEMLPAFTGLVINEFCATLSDQKDDHGEVSDWIELYNSGTTTIDIGGLFITDNLNNKRKHRIATGSPYTVMPPDTYLLLWADEDLHQGVAHLNFKLSSQGESIGIYQEMGTELLTLDEVTYGPVGDFESYSRIPNGTGPFSRTGTLTPGEANPLVSDILKEKLVNALYPNPTNKSLFIRAKTELVHASIFDVHGRKVKDFGSINTEEPLNVEGLLTGVYLIRIRSGDEEQTMRFVKQ